MEKLDYLRNLCKVQVLSNVTSSDTDSSQMQNKWKQSEKIRKGKRQWPPPLKPFLFRVCLFVAPLVHLLLMSLKLKQLKPINNPLCYFNDQIFFTLTSYGDHLEYTNKDQTFCFTEVSDTFINNHLSLYVIGNSIEKPIMTNHVKEAG